MSLLVWLPLINDFHNQGLDRNVTVSGTNTSFITGGKIGNCVKLGYSNDFTIPSMEGKKLISIAYWVKINTATSTLWLDPIHYYSTDGTTDYVTRQEFYSNCTLTGFWYLGGSISGKTIEVNKWTHFTITANYSNGEVCFYKDGILQLKTTNLNTSNYVKSVNFKIGENGLDLCENDVRIYDHCLSPKEVEEISKGLVLHYKLDNNGLGNPNLFKGGYQVITTSSGDTATGSLSLDTTKMPLSSLPGKTFTFTYDYSVEGAKLYNNTGDWSKDRYGIHLSYNYTNGSTTTTAYPGTGYLTISGTGRAVLTFTIPSGITINNFGFGILPFNKPASGNNATWYLKNVKLEEGNIDHGYTPNFDNSDIIFDSSGYNNNGTIVGNLNTITPSSRYNCATYLSNNAYIRTNKRPIEITAKDAITVNIWINFSTWLNPVSCTEGGGWNFENSSGILFPVYVSGVGYKVANSGILPSTLINNWHMLTGIYNKTTVKIYIDGELKKSLDTGTNADIGYNNNYIFLGAEASGNLTAPASTGYVGGLSDFRIYATALSAALVKELYTTSMSIDSSGNIHAREVSEL